MRLCRRNCVFRGGGVTGDHLYLAAVVSDNQENLDADFHHAFASCSILTRILRGQTLLAVLEILSGQAAILRDMVSLEKGTR